MSSLVGLKTPMITAALNSHIEVIRILAQARVNPNAIAAGPSPIIVDARISNWHGHLDATRLLLDAGASASTEAGRTSPLTEAARDGHTEIVRCLLRAGANVDNQSRMSTPLAEASRMGHINVMRLLIGAKANLTPSGMGNDLFSPLALAIKYNHPKVVEILIDAGAPGFLSGSFGKQDCFSHDSVSYNAAAYGSTEVLEMLIYRGFDVNKFDERAQTTISHAADWGNMGATTLIVTLFRKCQPLSLH
ncbi:ankyrin repeat-containing domain protein [Aspergillus insuetus]